MKLCTALSIGALFLSVVDAISLVKRNGEAPRAVGMPIQRRRVGDPVERERLRRRQTKTLQAGLDNLETLYFANATLGTPPQRLRLHLDTGSSDLWVNSVSSSLCRTRRNPCSESGTYNANDSSTYEYVNGAFNISYVDGSGASGDYARDTFTFGGTTLDQLQFGIGYQSTSSEGILGIGYMTNEVQVNRAGGDTYPNLPQLLVDQGVVSTNAYSLWLNDLDASTGSILFGGVDTQKYHGTLATLPIIRTRGDYAEFIISLTAMGFDGKSGSLFNNQAFPVLLDSGSSLTYLPDSIVSTIYDRYGATYDSRQGAAFVDCSLANSQGSVDFTFTSPTISVPLNELVVEMATTRSGDPICIFGISPAGQVTSVLGDTFLRSAYVVYDLQNNEISLAPTNFNATSSNVMEISQASGVPDATGVANAVTSLPVATGGRRNGGPTVTGKNAAVPMRTGMPRIGALAAAGAGLLLSL